MFRLALLLSVLGVLLVPGFLRACPSCSEVAPGAASADEEDPARLSRAYNNSIYLMAGMPYLLLGTVGFLVYRRLRPGSVGPMSPGEDVRSTHPGDRACSLPSRGDVS
jgi:hypothetical protein